jgi:hypothetical protein
MKTRRNAKQIGNSRLRQDIESRGHNRARRHRPAKSLSKSRDSEPTQLPPEFRSIASAPDGQLGNDGRIERVVSGLLNAPLHGEGGRFVRGQIKTLEHSAAFWTAIEPVKAEIVERTRNQLAVDEADGIETLLNSIDGYAEAVLLRKSAFAQLCRQGGPVTNKGKTRGLLQAWGTFFDREMRAAERLGLVRKSRRTPSPAEWLESLSANEHDQKGERDDEQPPAADMQAGQTAQTETD